MTDAKRALRPAPKLVRIEVACWLTWAWAIIGTVGAAWGHQWWALLWGANASVCAAGWWMAAKEWGYWRSQAMGLADELAAMLRWENPD